MKNPYDTWQCKVRMKIALIIDRLFPNACWTDLATWAIGLHSFSENDFSGKCRKPSCNADQSCGECYCGKNKYTKELPTEAK